MKKKLLNFKVFFIGFFLLLFNICQSWCQCNLTVNAGPDQIACMVPNTFQLSGTVSSTNIILSKFWTPINGLSDPNILNPYATISSPTSYVLNAKAVNLNNNLVVNGNFSAGNTGFSTQYTYNPNPSIPFNQLNEGQYTVGALPAPMHINWKACGDHTTGNGNMMLVNGSETANQNAWCQTVNVTPNTEYVFSVWVASVDPNGPCEIQFKINGSPVGNGNVGLSTTCLWVNLFVLWNSGSNTTAEICIEDVNTIMMGNDFAIDDIVFAPTCIASDSVLLTPISVKATASNNGPLCPGQTLKLDASGGNTYKWLGPFGFSATGQSATIPNVSVQNEGTYTIIVTGEGGCTATEDTEFNLLPSSTNNIMSTTCDSSAAGVFTQKLTNKFGCDSTIITTIKLTPKNLLNITKFSCDSSEVGVFLQNLSNKFGCDSTVITTVTLLPNNNIKLTEKTCDPASVGVFTKHYTNIFGCDSTITTVVTLMIKDTLLINSFSCDPSKIGVFTQNLINQFGCDSTVITNITLSQSDVVNLKSSSCDPNNVGVFIKNFTNQLGCDSTVITTISLFPSNVVNLLSMTCDSTSIAVFTQNLKNQFGCDSTVITTVNLSPPTKCNITILLSENSIPCGQIYGSFTIEASFGEGPFKYVWAGPTSGNGIISVLNTKEIIGNLPEGNYSVIITSATGATTEVQATIVKNIPPVVLTSITSDFNGADLSCSNNMDGSALVTAVGGVQPYTYYWSNGSASAFIGNLGEGEYNVTVTDATGCSSTSNIQLVAPLPFQFSFNVSDLKCFNSNNGAILAIPTGGISPYSYSINNGSPQSSSSFYGLSSGKYTLIAMDANGCSASDIIFINSAQAINVDLGDNLFIEYGDSVNLNAIINVPFDSLASINWLPVTYSECEKCLTQTVKPLITSSYLITISDINGCNASDNLTVFVDRTKHIYIPNAFSPDGNGLNDVFLIYAKEGEVKNIKSLMVYSRWGELLWQNFNFQPNLPNFGWKGTYRGQELNPGVFVWWAEIEFSDGTSELYKGDVTILK